MITLSSFSVLGHCIQKLRLPFALLLRSNLKAKMSSRCCRSYFSPNFFTLKVKHDISSSVVCLTSLSLFFFFFFLVHRIFSKSIHNDLIILLFYLQWLTKSIKNLIHPIMYKNCKMHRLVGRKVPKTVY